MATRGIAFGCSYYRFSTGSIRLVWLWQKELRDLHEYQADHGVISCGIDVKTYQLLLVEKAVGTRLYSMACGFDHCSLKKRITMMMERKTPRWKRLYILIAFPLAAGGRVRFRPA